MRCALILLALLSSYVCASASAEENKAPPRRVAVKAAHWIDVASGQRRDHALIVIEGERIVEVRSDGQAPAGVTVIDLGDATLLPGLIDCHTHITFNPGDYYTALFRRSAIDTAVGAHVFARRTLEAGFTTIRDVGAEELIDIALRNAINRGEVVGPRILAAGLPLGATGGHTDISGFSVNLRFEGLSGVVDGVDDIRKKVRFDVKNGADLIKFMATAGVLSEEESVGAAQYSQEEMNAVVEEAKRWGKKVAAHAHGAEGIKMAIRAGVASIEHGSLLDDEGIKLMKERGTYLDADIYNDDYILAEYKRLGYPDSTLEKERKIGKLQRENFKKAAQAGVKLAFGTDAGVYPHGDNAKQFAKMVEWGLTPIAAIRTATINAADLIGWSDRVGEIKVGYFADIIAVPGDPLADVRELEHPSFVMKGGAVIKGVDKH